MDNNIQNNAPSFPYKLQRLQVQSRHKEEALRRIETQELMLYMVNQPSRYHPHVFTSGCIILGAYKVHNSSSSLHLCTRKIIGHSELCKILRRCDQLTLKVVFTVCPAMLYP